MEPGIHELTAGYALDALDPDERRAYEDHLEECPSCREELAAFSEVASSLAVATSGPEPSRGLRDRIVAQAHAERQNVVPLRRRPAAFDATRALAGAAAVAAVAAIALGVWSIVLHNRLDDTRGKLSATIGVLPDPNARTISLARGQGRLVVAPGGRSALVVAGLSRAPSDRTYEVWVLRKGSAPAPSGLFTGGAASVVGVGNAVASGDVVAVTLERAGGARAPTTAPLVASKPV